MTNDIKAGIWVAAYLMGMWLSGGWTYAEDAQCRVNARAQEEASNKAGVYYNVERANCGDGFYILPATIGWPLYWFFRSSHEAFS